jgi:hypothetical protein
MNVSNKKISPCRCLVFAAWLYPFHLAKPKRLHKPKLEIFLHALRKSLREWLLHLAAQVGNSSPNLS